MNLKIKKLFIFKIGERNLFQHIIKQVVDASLTFGSVFDLRSMHTCHLYI